MISFFSVFYVTDWMLVVGSSLVLKKKVQRAYHINFRDYFSSCRYTCQCRCFVQYSFSVWMFLLQQTVGFWMQLAGWQEGHLLFKKCGFDKFQKFTFGVSLEKLAR